MQARSRRWRARLAVTLLVSAAGILTARPALAAGDCGGGDTPPARLLPNGGGCAGSLEGEPTGYWTYYAEDAYQVAATVDDLVTLEFTSSNCYIHAVAENGYPFYQQYDDEPGRYSYFASSTGLQDITIVYSAGPAFAPESGSALPDPVPDYPDDCYSQPLTYTIKATVIANTRPAITSITGPTTVPPGGGGSYRVNVSDPDGNLAYVKAKYGTIDSWQEVSGSSGGYTWSFSFDYSSNVRFAVQDDLGYEVAQYYLVSVVQNDCGTGGDVGTLAVAFPFDCSQAHLWPPMSDSLDSYTFSVPAGTERVYAAYAKVSGDLSARITLTPPAGAAVSRDNGGVAATAAEGLWRADVSRLGGKGAYTLAIKPAGAPAAPVVSASAPGALNQGETFTVSLSATDPNGMRLFYRVDFGDGNATRLPYSSGTYASGTAQTTTHQYRTAALSHTIVVTAENDDGLVGSTSIPVTVDPHDDCGYGAGYDAPDPLVVQTTSTVRDVKPACTGKLGYWVMIQPNVYTEDRTDRYQLTRSQMERVTFSLSTSPGLSARIVVKLSALQWSGTSSLTIEPLLPALRYFVEVQRVSGAGSYTLTLTESAFP